MLIAAAMTATLVCTASEKMVREMTRKLAVIHSSRLGFQHTLCRTLLFGDCCRP